MQKHYNYLDIDLDNKNNYRRLNAMQGDIKTRYILVNLYSNNLAYDLSNCTVKIYGLKRDKTIFFNNAVITNEKLGQFEIELTNQALAVAGELKIQILILGTSGEKLTSSAFFIDVGESIIDENAIESANEFNVFTQAMKDFQKWDGKFEEKYDGLEAEYAENITELGSQIKDKASKQELEVERARIDLLAKIENGQTEGNTELLDIRIAIDGEEYDTAGEAVRTQIKTIKENLESYEVKERTNQLIDLDNILVEGEKGYINESGGISYSDDYCCTKYIEIDVDKYCWLYSTNNTIRPSAFYDENKAFLSYATLSGTRTKPPLTAKYIRVSVRIIDGVAESIMLTQNQYAKTVEDYTKTSINSNKIRKLLIDNFSEILESTQLIDFKNLKLNGIQGYVDENGNIGVSSEYYTTPMIEVIEGETLHFISSDRHTRPLGFYDENFNFISMSYANNWIVPVGAKYCRISVLYKNSTFEEVMLTRYDTHQTVEPYQLRIKNTLLNDGFYKTVNIQLLGDSITDNTWGDKKTWANYITQLLGENCKVTNNAVGGERLVPHGTSKDIYTLTKTILDVNSDIVVIWGGTNDWAATPPTPIGDFLTNDVNTIHGSVKAIIEYICTNTACLPIFITPLKRHNSVDETREKNNQGIAINSLGDTLADVSKAIVDTCKFYSIPCLDLNSTSGINELNIKKFANDGLHLSAPVRNGEIKVAKQICNFIRQYC